jgi:CDP-paratose 2-epimerase
MSGDGRPILVTGGAGFIGSNLADRLAADGYKVMIYDALSRVGVERNLEWLQRRHGARIKAITADIRDENRLADAAAQAQVVFHLAAQVAVTTSLVEPRDDFSTNIVGTLNLLDALRSRNPSAPIVFASTNKVYGDLADLEFRVEADAYVPGDPRTKSYGIGEDRPLDFHTPYGCSKGAADQYVLDYARSFGLRSAVLRMSCIYGQRQMGTEDQGWVAHFLIRAIEGEPITLYGDGRQVRDILDVANAIDAYIAAWQRIDAIKGRAFNLGGGPTNAVSLLQLLDHVGALLGHELEIGFEDWRAGDQRYFVADTRAAEAALGLGTKRPWRRGVAALAEWLAAERGLPLPQGIPREGVAA